MFRRVDYQRSQFDEDTQFLEELLTKWDSGETHMGHVSDELVDFSTKMKRLQHGPVNSMSHLLKTANPHMSQPDGDEHLRTDVTNAPANISNTMFAINHSDTQVRDDAISFCSNTMQITVHITDVNRWLPMNGNTRDLVQECLKMGCTMYGYQGRTDMFPTTACVDMLSLSGNKHRGECISCTFCINEDGSPQLVDVSLTRQNRPYILTYSELQRMILQNTACNLHTQNPSHDCDKCISTHMKELWTELLRFRRWRESRAMQKPNFDWSRTDNGECTVHLGQVVTRQGRRITVEKKKYLPTEAEHLVQECMICSSNMMARFMNNENATVIYFGHGTRAGGKLTYSSQIMLNGNNGLFGYVPWTSPIRKAQDYLNCELIHIHIRTRELVPDGNTRRMIEQELRNMEDMLGSPNVVDCFRSFRSRYFLYNRFEKNMKTTLIFEWLWQQNRKQHPSKTSYVVLIEELEIEEGVFAGNLYFCDYGFNIHNFDIESYSEENLQHCYNGRLCKYSNFEADVEVTSVDIEDWYVSINLQNIKRVFME